MSTPQPPSPSGPPDDDRSGLSSLQRAMIVLAALGALLIAFVVFQGGDDENPSSTTSAQTTATQQPTTATETATTETETETGTTETETVTTETTTTEPPEPEEETIRVVDGKPQGGVQTLTFEKGERVRFKVESDVADHVHVHGYDLMMDVSPDKDARFRFEATIEGRFEVELEDRGVQIAELEVTPS
jgi:heme/copper-type cytochrome/quinol oxidase subunit 2